MYVDPSIPKTSPLELLTDLLQAFAPLLREWTLDSIELARAILNAVDIFPYVEPSFLNELFILPDTAVKYTLDLEEDISTLLWHGRARHAKVLSKALADRLCRLKAETVTPIAPAEDTDVSLARLEVLVHPWPLKHMAEKWKEEALIHSGLRQDFGSPLRCLALALYHLHSELLHFSKEAAELVQTAGYFIAECKVNHQVPLAINSPIPCVFDPYWALHIPKYPEALDASEFMYVYVHELVDLHPQLLTTIVGRRILRGLVLYVGQRLALEFHDRPMMASRASHATERPPKRPRSPTPPPHSPPPLVSLDAHSEDEDDTGEKDVVVFVPIQASLDQEEVLPPSKKGKTVIHDDDSV